MLNYYHIFKTEAKQIFLALFFI